MPTTATIRRGESGTFYSFVQPLGKLAHSRTNVWLIEEEGKSDVEFVAKGPSPEDDELLGWPAFQHELKMQRLFNEDKMIRPMMENIGITGFDNDKPNENIREIIVRIADCGSISEPGRREISSLTYRSPEVYFGKPWNQSTDIWSWGIILAQLLLAQVDFTSPGMYDAISTGTLENKTQAARTAMAADFDLFSIPLYVKEEGSSSLLPSGRPGPEDIYMWAVNMSEKGISGEDIQFLVDVLNPRPDVRPTAAEIIQGGYLKVVV
ncbi:hypothetical protein GGR58DRAFT_517579 [Xylaria digitata]|nr:hypothetical protein GGR58DRAFT_517579 [Xylaria digitata]